MPSSSSQARRRSGSSNSAKLGLPRETTIDPYNGEPLHVKKLPAGWQVYSVGMDLTDNSGTFAKVTDVGVGPIKNSTIH